MTTLTGDNEISRETGAAINQYESAQKATAEALRKASDESARAARNGFTTIHLGLKAIAAKLQQASIAVTSAHGEASNTLKLTIDAPEGENPHEIVARLSPVVQKMQDIKTKTTGAIQLLP